MAGKHPVRAIEFLVFSWMAKDCTSISKAFRSPILLSFLILLFKIITAPRRGARIHDPRDPKWHAPLTEPARLPPNKPSWKQVSVGLLRAPCLSGRTACPLLTWGNRESCCKVVGWSSGNQGEAPQLAASAPPGGRLLGPGEPLCAAGEDAASRGVTGVTGRQPQGSERLAPALLLLLPMPEDGRMRPSPVQKRLPRPNRCRPPSEGSRVTPP